MASQEFRLSEVSDPICSQCKHPITDTVVVAMGKSWHQQHFACAHCRRPITESTFRVQGGQPYCEADYFQLFGKTCTVCNKPIRRSCLTALNRNWHRECFKCTRCQQVIAMREFTEIRGNPYCMDCGRQSLAI